MWVSAPPSCNGPYFPTNQQSIYSRYYGGCSHLRRGLCLQRVYTTSTQEAAARNTEYLNDAAQTVIIEGIEVQEDSVGWYCQPTLTIREGGLRWAKYGWEQRGTIRTKVRQCYVNLKSDFFSKWWENCSFLPSSHPPSLPPFLPSTFLPSTNVYQVPDTELDPGHAKTKKSWSSSLRILQSNIEKQNGRSGRAPVS